MTRICLPFKVHGFVRFSILLFAAAASGQVAVNPSSVNFSNVQISSSSTQSLVLGNSGQSTVTLSQAALVGSGFSLSAPVLPLTLSAGQKAVFSVSFTPKASGSASGTLSLLSSIATVHDHSGKHNSTSSTTTTVSLSGIGTALSTASTTPGQLVANPGNLGFATLPVGSTLTQSATLTNSGGSSVTISQATIAGAGFSMNGLTWPFTLAVGQSATFSVTFAPVSAGNASGSISVSSDASTPTLTILLAGTATQGQLAVTPASANFGTVAVGTTQNQRATLTASGSSVTVSSASVTSPEFSLSGIALPLTLASGQSIPFTLTFTPQVSGTASATVSFVSNATNSAAETLTGTGAVPPSHSVTLSWSDASGVVGYNVYRGSQSGGPYAKINPVLDASATYTDSSVQGGQAYYYVATAVDSSGAQSGYSNEIQAVIPSP